MGSKALGIAVFIFLSISTCYSATQDVKYAGFAYTGNADKAVAHNFKENFKYTAIIIDSSKDKDGQSIFDRELLKFFKKNKASVNNFNLIIGEKSETKLVMALALARENLSVTNINDIYKMVVNLCCDVIFLDFDGKKVVASYPIYLEYIDARKDPYSEEDKVNLLKKLYFSPDFSILSILKERLGNLKLKNDARLSMKVVNVEIEDEAKDKLEIKDNLLAFKSLIAQKFSDRLSGKLNICVLPYQKDYVGATMSVQFSDERVQDFRIPESSYALDLTLRKLTKEPYKEGIAEDAFLYGAYSTIKVTIPGLNNWSWEKKVKYGAVKTIPKLQKTFDDFAIYDELTGLVMSEIVKEMKADKQFYREVIEKCLNN